MQLKTFLTSSILIWLCACEWLSAQPDQWNFSTLAGVAQISGYANGPARKAKFYFPGAVAVDTTGNVYVADRGNNAIRKITLAGEVSLYSTSNSRPGGLAADTNGNLYVANDNTIEKISPSGKKTSLAKLPLINGNPEGRAEGLVVDNAGNVYVADSRDNTIRKVTPDGVVTTLAGLSQFNELGFPLRGSTDGIGSEARFDHPSGVAVDIAGNVYVADQFNHTIRKITPNGVVTTLAGLAGFDGSENGVGSAARFYSPSGVAVDIAGNVYVADQSNHTIRKITPNGVVTTLAGLVGQSGRDNGVGDKALFSGPYGVAVDNLGNVYVTEQDNHIIRKITSKGDVSDLAGPLASAGSVDGTGDEARFSRPEGVVADSEGNVYVADSGNHTIRKITIGGEVTTWAGMAKNSGSTDGTTSSARFSYPSGLAMDSQGNIYVADTLNNTVRKITPTGIVTTLAGLAETDGSSDGIGSAARFNGPTGVAVDGAGNVYVADKYNHTIRKVSPTGVVTTLAGLAGTEGEADGTGSTARFFYPYGVASDDAGTVYVSDSLNGKIRQITPNGVVVTFAGGGDSGAYFSEPLGLAVKVLGDVTVYMVDGDNTINYVYQDPFFGDLRNIFAGSKDRPGSADGAGTAASFNNPHGIALGDAGIIYVADTSNNTIRKGTFGTVPTPPTPPNLGVRREGDKIIVSWPVSATGFALESHGPFTPGTVWLQVTTGITTSGTDKTLSTTIQPTSLFFRLRKP